MKVIKAKSQKLIKEAAKEAFQILKTGGIVIYPTDTAYGIGANALDRNAVKKIYKIKKRDSSKPTHVIVRDWKMINKLAYTNLKAKALFDNLLPGPLTIILPKKPIVSDILTADLPTIGIRIPKHPVTLAISDLLQFPYTTPSANISGGKISYSMQEVMSQIDPRNIDLFIDSGKLPINPLSTLVDLANKSYKILRNGSIKEDKIKQALKLSV